MRFDGNSSASRSRPPTHLSSSSAWPIPIQSKAAEFRKVILASSGAIEAARDAAG